MTTIIISKETAKNLFETNQEFLKTIFNEECLTIMKQLYNPKNSESVGKIMDNLEVKILNEEICVSGPNVMKGYWKDQEETDKVLIEHENKIWYKTGDSGRLEDKFLFINGRISENYKMSNGKFVNVAMTEANLKKYILECFDIF